MANLILKQDGLYNQNGEKQPLVFGDKEQIALIRQRQKELSIEEEIMEAIESDNHSVVNVSWEVKYTADIDFECICKKHVRDSVEDLGSDDPEFLEDDIVTCFHCLRKYELKELNGNLFAKLVYTPKTVPVK